MTSADIPADRASFRAGAPSDRTANRGVMPLMVGAALAVGCLAMPIAYALIAFQGAWFKALRPTVAGHIALIATANVIVMLAAIATTGRLDRKLANVFAWTLVAHGAAALIILVGRQWYSIPILLSGVIASSALGSAFAIARQRKLALRVGVIGPRHAIMQDPAFDCAVIADPSQSVRRYDVIVMTSGEGLSAAWLPTLASALLAGKRVRHVSEFLEETRGRLSIQHFDLDQLPEGGLASYRTRKRVVDLLCVAVITPLALPLLAVGCFAVLVTMGRPILFIQSRIGQGGRPFRMLKLRTMRSVDPGLGAQATVANDARVTPVGRWLRRFRIDEIPQLWNVVAGDMSFIGPRPEWTALAEGFSAQEPAYTFRHLVRPGITGWAQVKGRPAADLAETRVKLGYDLFYVKHLSFSLDLQILLRTVWTLLAGGGVR